jgi:hypothetical protein
MAERELGLESRVAVMAPGPFGYEHDVDVGAGVDQPVWRRLIRRARFLRQAVHDYDLFHFNYGQTLLTVRQLGFVFDEIALLKRLGKTVFVTYQGCDVRPKASCPCRQPHCFAEDRYRRPAAQRVLRHADRVFYLNPDLRHWLPGARFTPYASVDTRRVEPVPPPDSEEVVVAHAPTRTDVKGTLHVVEAVERLRTEGVPIRLDLVRGVSRDEVLAHCASAHIIVDQLLLGWYGALAVEGMALQRPVLANIREEEPEDNPFGEELPVVRTSVATLVDDLRALAGDRPRREALGVAGRAFVAKCHDPRRIAADVLDGVAALEPLTQAEAAGEPPRASAARAPR